MREKIEMTKIEKSRLDREKRLNALKTKDGGKKQIQTSSRLGRIMFPLVAVAIVLAAALWLAFATGFAQGMMNPLSVGGEKISMKEFTYYYKSTLGTYQSFVSYGLAPADANGMLDVTAACSMPGYENKTWKDYVLDQTVDQIKEVKAISAVAAEKGFTFNDEDQKTLDEQLTAIRASYPTDAELNKVLFENYGQGVSVDYFTQMMKTAILSDRFATEYPKSYNINNDEIQSYYNENKDTMDLVSYRQFVFEIPTEAETEEDKTSAQAENKSKAAEMLEKITDAESFKAEALNYAADDKKVNYESGDITLNEKVTSSYTSAVADIQTWLYDETRQVGDKTQISSGNNEYVLYFEGRERLDNKLPTVYHILIGSPTATSNPDEAQLEKDKVTAEELAAKISSEDDAKKLGEIMKAEGTTREATLLDNISWKTMDTAFNDWIFDEGRKPGDVGVVKTTYGYHVIYYISQSEQAEWEYKSELALRSKKFSDEKAAWLTEERFNAVKSNAAMRYVV